MLPSPVFVDLSADSIITFSTISGKYIAKGVQDAIGKGLNDANRRIEREDLSNQESSQ